MMDQYDMHTPVVVFYVQQGMFGVNANHVVEMIKAPQILQVPHLTPPVVGMMNQRNHIIPIADLRVLFGMEPMEQERQALIELLRQREQDHIHWLDELESSLRLQRAFTLTTDPHKCAFGQWYDHFHTDSVALEIVMNQFDIPHRHIHSLGVTLTTLAQQGKVELALLQLEEARAKQFKQFKQLTALFAKVRETIRTKMCETVIVVETAQRHFAIMADRLESVDTLTELPMPLPSTVHTSQQMYTTHSFRSRNCATLGLLLDIAAIPCQAFTADLSAA
jgi:purine-binding chemotaxis protein CheW